MAKSGERRMVFDTRGRRKHVLRVVYAVLALLMGGSLLLTLGPVNLGGVTGSSSSASEALDDQAERLEDRLAANPNDEQLLLSLTRTRIAAGNSQLEVTPGTEAQPVPAAAREDFEAASQAWSRYLKQVDGEPSAAAAQLVAGTFFRLAESTTSFRETEANIAKATAAQRIAAEERPNVGSLSTLAIYEYYDGDFAAGDRTAKQAAARAPSRAEAANIEKQMDEFRKRAKQYDKRRQQFAKVQREAGGGQSQNPLGGLGPPGGASSE